MLESRSKKINNNGGFIMKILIIVVGLVVLQYYFHYDLVDKLISIGWVEKTLLWIQTKISAFHK